MNQHPDSSQQTGIRHLNAIRITMLALMLLITHATHAAPVTRTSAFTYYEDGSGLLKKEIIEPGNSELCLVTKYDYDGYGNKTSATTRNCNNEPGSDPTVNDEAAAPTGDGRIQALDGSLASITSSNDYAAGTGWVVGQFPTKSTNALGQFETKTYDAKFGAVLTLTGPNGLPTTWEYDGFGRKTLETRADSTQTKWEYLYCTSISGGTANCPTIGGATGAWVLITTPLGSNGTTQNGPISKTYYDGLNREIRKETEGFDGTGTSTAIYQDTWYDSLGRISQKSRPYYNGGTSSWTTVTYDSLGRVYQENRPDETTASGAVTTYAYNGLSVTVTAFRSATETQTRTTKKNSQGQVVEVTDNADKKLSFAYDAFGNLTQTTDPLGNVTTLEYDLRGRKTRMIDPDMGDWRYAYNALGQLIGQTDAKSQVSTMVYDLLGRMTERHEVGLNSYWYYDTGKNSAACPKGVGKLCQAETDTGYNRVHSYDDKGRPVSTSTTLGNDTYTSGVTYNAEGRVIAQTYPGGFTVKLGYTALGYLKDLRDNSSNALYWKAERQNAEGRVDQERVRDEANGIQTLTSYSPQTGRIMAIQTGPGGSVQDITYAYDRLGNLISRSSANLIENFYYDNLNRLDSSTLNSSGVPGTTKTYTYDALGNLKSRSDISVTGDSGYGYPASGTNSVRPHAVSRVNLIGAGNKYRAYQYDANGNLANVAQYIPQSPPAQDLVDPGHGRTVTWTSFNMPSVIYDDAETDVQLEFTQYGPEHQRVTALLTKTENNVASTRSTVYLNPDSSGGLLFEKETKFDGAVEARHFLTAGGQVVAQVIRTTRTVNGLPETTWATRYLHRDHLGSVTAVTDDSGNVIETMAYEPFGKRRVAAGQSTEGADDPGNTLRPVTTVRGFTNHEHVDELGIVHMNGRIYDPAIGRFLSADPQVQAPDNIQSYNRYSYAWNSPLNGTDPSGYSFLGQLFGCAFDCSPGNADSTGAAMFAPATNRQVFQTSVAIFGAYYVGTVWAPFGSSSASLYASIGNGMAGGFTGGFVGSGGNLEAGMFGAITGGMFGAVGANFAPGSFGSYAGHAAVGCFAGEMSGGGCARGAISQLVSKGATNLAVAAEWSESAQFAVATVAGGTASVIGGGKFANGAVTGAFGYLFNQLNARPRPRSWRWNQGENVLEEYYPPLREESAGSIRDVNRHTRGKENCVNCAIATDALLAGRPASALPGSATPISVLEQAFGRQFSAPLTINEVQSAVAASGPGTRGIVFGVRPIPQVGHVFNVVNQAGEVRFLDGQTGSAARLDGYNSFRFLRTD